MDPELIIPKDYSLYITHFNRSEYAGLFARYLERCRDFFERTPQPDAAVVVEYAEGLVRPFKKKLVLFDMQRLFALYTVPASLELGTQAGRVFADELRRRWAERHPDNVFGSASYGEIMAGFEDAGILGFKKFFN